MNEKIPVLSVSQYVLFINDLVSVTPVIVEGEVSNFRDIPGRNFCYFDIKDKDTAIKCFQGFWYSKKVALKNGETIRVFGNSSLQKNGSLVINVKDVVFVGDGELQKRYDELKDGLEKEGLFDVENKQDISPFPLSVGLIAGKNSSAYHDVVAELQERWGGIEIFFCPSKVQGVNAKSEIIKSIRYFNQKNKVDTLILARGGGSLEDLQAFDSEEVVREIFSSKIPIISAIGHEDHWTLSDFVSDIRAKTPTKAAQIAVPSRSEVLERFEFLETRSRGLVKSRVGEVVMEVEQLNQRLLANFREDTLKLRQKLRLKEEFLGELVRKILLQKTNELESFGRILEVLNPKHIMSRGYAVVQKDGKRIKNVKQLDIGDVLDIRLQNGEISSKIQGVKKV